MNSDDIGELYILDEEGNPVLEHSFSQWHKWHRSEKGQSLSRVAEAILSWGDMRIRIYTSFWGCDGDFFTTIIDAPNEIRERFIAIYRRDYNSWQDYETLAKALMGHFETVQFVNRTFMRVRDPLATS